MAEKLSDLFERAQAPTVIWQGHTVHSMVELPPVADGAVLSVEFEDPTPARPQGLRIKVRDGAVLLEGHELTDIVLWSDSAPCSVRAEVRTKGKEAKIRLWNCWRDPAGTVQAWIGNAGMLVEETSTGVILQCSDGFDEVTFGDLVAKVATSRPTHVAAGGPGSNKGGLFSWLRRTAERLRLRYSWRM